MPVNFLLMKFLSKYQLSTDTLILLYPIKGLEYLIMKLRVFSSRLEGLPM